MMSKTPGSTASAKRSLLFVASLFIIATADVSGASQSAQSAGAPGEPGTNQSMMLAEAMPATKLAAVKKTSAPHEAKRKSGKSKSGKTWLNPQPEPPSPAKGGKTWLNPQPEPPRPDTQTKSPH